MRVLFIFLYGTRDLKSAMESPKWITIEVLESRVLAQRRALRLMM
jgi:hypothetical protein